MLSACSNNIDFVFASRYMAGGGSDDPNIFNPEIFSWRRIRLAPTLVLIGFGIQVYAILLDPQKTNPKK